MKRFTFILCAVTIAFIFVSCGKDTAVTSKDTIVLSEKTPTPSPTISATNTPTSTPSQTVAVLTPTPAQTQIKTTPTPAPSTPKPTPTSTPQVPQSTPTPQATPNLHAGLVFIDAGHGGNDPGTSANGLVEKEVTLDVSKRLNQILINNKIRTEMIRTEDVFIDHKKRIALANEKEGNLYISIHCDWFSNPAYGGTQTFYINKSELKFGNLSEIQYAKNVQNELIKSMKSNNRGIAERADLAVVKYAKMPSVLVEMGFLSNPTDSANLATSEYRQKIAEGMATAIINSLETANNPNLR